MRTGPTLPRAFFDRPCLEVARELLGKLLVRELPDGERLVGRLVEVEAYLGDGTDPASHADRGPTPRNRSMFGPPGRLYTYRSYGIHTCANVVCEAEGRGAAVLLRAIEPLAGIETMRRLRGLGPEAKGRAIASGPARLCQALGLGPDDDGASLLRGPLRLREAAEGWGPLGRRVAGPRVGITKAAELPYRFYLPDCGWVSPFRAGVRRSRPGTRPRPR